MAHTDYPPMLLSDRPFDLELAGWLYEIKFDGYRLMADCQPGTGVTLRTKAGTDATKWFPEIAKALQDLDQDGRYVLDGEVCAMDDIGRAQFEVLHERAKRRRWYPGAPPVVYAVFDLLVNAGVDITQQPLSARKAALVDLFARSTVRGVLVVTGFEGEGEGTRIFNGAVKPLNLEGLVAKRLDSVYQPGVRSPDWVKVKRAGAVPKERFKRSS